MIVIVTRHEFQLIFRATRRGTTATCLGVDEIVGSLWVSPAARTSLSTKCVCVYVCVCERNSFMPAGCVNIKLINSPRKNHLHQIILDCTEGKLWTQNCNLKWNGDRPTSLHKRLLLIDLQNEEFSFEVCLSTLALNRRLDKSFLPVHWLHLWPHESQRQCCNLPQPATWCCRCIFSGASGWSVGRNWRGLTGEGQNPPAESQFRFEQFVLLKCCASFA